MNKELIKEYINVAIENWYKAVKESIAYDESNCCFKTKEVNCWREEWVYIDFYENNSVCWTKTLMNVISFEKLITSKEFIVAIAKWLRIIHWRQYLTHGLDDLIDDITTEQAIAIRDCKLDDFINNILKWKTD